MSVLAKVGYVKTAGDDWLDKIIRLQALVAARNLIGRNRWGTLWRIMLAPVWLGAGFLALAEGRQNAGIGGLLAFTWFLPMALANARVACRQSV